MIKLKEKRLVKCLKKALLLYKPYAMKHFLFVMLICFFSWGCSRKVVKTINSNNSISQTSTDDFIIAFGSCNKETEANHLWDDVINIKPNVWIWGGDIMYADSDHYGTIKSAYQKVLDNKLYSRLRAQTEIMGTWDDHDYGLNDGGREFSAKTESQRAFLEFINPEATETEQSREGIYTSKDFNIGEHSIRIIILDTRYHRSALEPSTDKSKRYQPTTDSLATVLGSTQWRWLEDELQSSKADYNVIMSSIQFLSSEHGFETWGNFPIEQERLIQLIESTRANGVILLSGDRHISEISLKQLPSMSYPLIDFTSSGMTHAYTSFKGEPNKYRVVDVYPMISFGVLRFNFKTDVCTMQIIDKMGNVVRQFAQYYP